MAVWSQVVILFSFLSHHLVSESINVKLGSWCSGPGLLSWGLSEACGQGPARQLQLWEVSQTPHIANSDAVHDVWSPKDQKAGINTESPTGGITCLDKAKLTCGTAADWGLPLGCPFLEGWMPTLLKLITLILPFRLWALRPWPAYICQFFILHCEDSLHAEWDTEMGVMERKRNQFMIHKLSEKSQKRKNLPYCPHENLQNTLCEDCSYFAADCAEGHLLLPMRNFI